MLENQKSNFISDDTLLKIKGNISEDRSESREYIKKTARAIYTVLSKHQVAHLKCVGAASISNAIKAAAIARENVMEKDGTNLYIEPYFGEAEFDGNIKTAIIITVKQN